MNLFGGIADDVGAEFTLKFYDASSDSVIDINETVTFSVNDIQWISAISYSFNWFSSAADDGGTGGGDDDSAGYVDNKWLDRSE